MTQLEKRRIDLMELEGTSFGKYDVLGLLGKGGMALVYKALDRQFESHVALKFLLPEYAREEQTRQRFLDEARLQYKLRHPNLVRVTSQIEEGSVVGLVMDYIDGLDLSALLEEKKKPLSLREIRDIFLPVLDAVGYAHAQKIIHRDLKPSNILIETRGTRYIPYVMDFGIAKSLEDSGKKTKTGSFLGSPQYSSPEQIRSDKAIDHRTDIYALGCTLYELLGGSPPFGGKETLQQVLFSHLTDPPPPLASLYPEVGPLLDRLLEKALAKERDLRFPSCEAFAEEVSLVFEQIKDLPPPLLPLATPEGAGYAAGHDNDLGFLSASESGSFESQQGRLSVLFSLAPGVSSKSFLFVSLLLVFGSVGLWWSGSSSRSVEKSPAPTNNTTRSSAAPLPRLRLSKPGLPSRPAAVVPNESEASKDDGPPSLRKVESSAQGQQASLQTRVQKPPPPPSKKPRPRKRPLKRSKVFEAEEDPL